MDFSTVSGKAEGHAEEDDSLVFHYSRAERLKKAPKEVRDFYDGKIVTKRGLFKSLVATKANRFILFTLVLCFLLVLFMGFFGPKENVDTIRGVKLNLSAFVYEEFGEKVYVDLKLDPPAGKFLSEYAEEIPVKVAFSAVNVDGQVVEKTVSVEKYAGKALYEARKNRLSQVREEKRADKHKVVQVGEFCVDVKTSFDDYDIISINAEVEIKGETKTVSAPVRNLTSLIQ